MRPARASLVFLALVLLSLGLVFLLRQREGARAPDPRAMADSVRTEAARLPRAPEAVERRAIEDGAPAESPAKAAEAGQPSAIAAEEPTAPGTIEGLVLRGGEPVGGGEAWKKRNSFLSDASWCAHSGPDAASERTRVGPDGTFRFLAEAGDHCVGVELEGGQRRARAFHVVEGQPSSRWVIALGSSEIRGHVWSEDGLPAADVSIWFSGGHPTESRGYDEICAGSTRTDAGGGYRITGLEPGSYGLEALLGTDRFDPRTRHVFATELGPDEVKTIDFGSAHPLPTWTCRLLSANGTPLPRVSMSLRLQDLATRTTFMSRQDVDGAFRAQLSPGTYDVTLTLMFEEHALGQFAMGERDQESEFRLPGAWVDVSIRYVGSKGDPQAALYMIMVHAAPRGSQGKAFTACPGYDGHWHLLGLPAGDYDVWASVGGMRPATENFPLLVREGESEIPMEITVGDR